MAIYRYLSGTQLPESPAVGQLLRAVKPVQASASCMSTLDCFHDDESLIALPVVDDALQPIAIIDRHTFVEFFSRPYIREVFGKRSLIQLLSVNTDVFPVCKPIVVDATTSIDDVAQIIIGAGMQHMVSGFIVTRGNSYAGVANGHDLLNEITQRKQSELYYLAHYDTLTKVPNRMLFTDRLTQACREAQRNETSLALMFIDVDRFKQVNDSMGHRFGDNLLRAVSERLIACARDCDTVARLGGDEFAILMDGIKGQEDAEALAQRLVESVREPFNILDREISISLSVGIALYPRDDTDVGNLLSKADAAMYEAKTSGRNGYRSFVPGLSIYSLERMSLESDLRNAVANKELVLHYQPQINLANDQVCGVEALIRWQHPRHGLLSPGSFIGIAEETGLIISIGDWVLAEACRQQRLWSDAGIPALRMSVNISALQFRQPDFSHRVKAILAETGVDPNLLELELTESVVMHNAPLVMEMLEDLRAQGVHLAIDDFGAGFSSLSYLRRFPIERLKIDQSFVRGLDHMPVNESIIRAIVAMAQSLSLRVVAEGTETDAEVAMVRHCRCDEVQGYRIARPMPAGDFTPWLDEFRRQYVMRDFFDATTTADVS